MNTIELLNSLHAYTSLLTFLMTMELNDRQTKGDQSVEFVKTVSLQYETITLKLSILEKGLEKKKHTSPPYLQCTFKIEKDNVILTEIYCQDKMRESEIKKILLSKSYSWNTEGNKSTYSREILNYLAIADEIAVNGHLCSSGDNYRPGYFSEIRIEEDQIILQQVNHWNSRSIDHKKNYHLRDLEFLIPTKPAAAETTISFDDYIIGKMRVHFSDRSSENNKECGNRIMEKIVEKKNKIESEQK